ncbi:class I lanthipeptide [Hymenobacter siberiensis]|uniref:class I lanthipeptide n=1 Tax=Hymenobacter siberiensis TaxID=2848396 RepID=UPI001C1E6DE5|nr:class I lanthipeptide [Hymenobacter siberiensis]MBU6120260.1 class I lanthipeptide [Hymenobacter siberiensis]
MKKIPFADKLDLSKEIIANLSEEQLLEIEGGAFPSELSCWFTSCFYKPEEVAE